MIWSGIFHRNRCSLSLLFREESYSNPKFLGIHKIIAFSILSLFSESYIDPKTVTRHKRYDVVDPLPESFVIPASHLADMKYTESTVVFSHHPDFDHQGVIVDVISIGSATRPEHLTSQINTWASHINI